VQLQSRLQSFQQAGIAVVALTYDAPALQKKFIEKYAIGYPLLSDIGAASVTGLGVLNTEYKPGDSAYGVAHPGVFVVNPQQQIVGKLFIEDFKTRVDADGVLAFAQDKLR
jgi:peroxiredoxin